MGTHPNFRHQPGGMIRSLKEKDRRIRSLVIPPG